MKLMAAIRRILSAATIGPVDGTADVFECPVCAYHGAFEALDALTGRRLHARCPRCGALERHRLQYLVTQSLLSARSPSQMSCLHIAPEAFFRERFAEWFGRYETADAMAPNVDHRVDVCRLPFADATYDLVFASHVLEHVRDDRRAIGEIRRVLKSDGLAILPVPIVATETIEYPAPNPHEANHVRAPGLDYIERFEPHFSRVDSYESGSWPGKHQLFLYEDRTRWPTAECPLRPAMPGERHVDIVPVCYA